jgi:peptidoglycan-associated lipoprotein
VFLIDLGIAETRMQTLSFGEERPLDPGENEEAWAKNRRAHFVINE